MFLERRLPYDFIVSAGYVGTRTNNGYVDINRNYAETGGNANRQLFTLAGNADILDWAARTRARYHSLQMAVNRPFKGGLMQVTRFIDPEWLVEFEADAVVESEARGSSPGL